MNTQQQRKQEFDRLFEALPGTNVERINTVCTAIMVKPGTVRIWRMKAPPRVISARSLTMLKQALPRVISARSLTMLKQALAPKS